MAAARLMMGSPLALFMKYEVIDREGEGRRIIECTKLQSICQSFTRQSFIRVPFIKVFPHQTFALYGSLPQDKVANDFWQVKA